jgi:hypothetical protein
MANVVNWIVETNWTTMFQGGDLASLPSGDAVAASNGSGAAAAITNGTQLALYCDVSIELTISSTTPTAGAWLGLWLAALQQDGTTYGDGNFPIGASYGTQKTYQPAWQPVGVIPLNSFGAQTLLAGMIQGFLMPPGSWLPIFGTGGSAPTLSSTASNSVIKYRTYNPNLNGS